MTLIFAMVLMTIIVWLASIEIRQFGLQKLIADAKQSIDDALEQVKKL
jgi:hypothetical protein